MADTQAACPDVTRVPGIPAPVHTPGQSAFTCRAIPEVTVAVIALLQGEVFQAK